MSAATRYVRSLLQRGRHHFTTEEAVEVLGGERALVTRALKRLIDRGELASPFRSFYVIVTPEYHSLGCLPAEQFIPQLMEMLGEAYHVGLLSAAQFHGAAHHRPQRFQIIVQSPRASISCGKVWVDFFARKDIAQVSTVSMNTPRGRMLVSSPEATALELIGYSKHAGGLDNVATVLAELVDGLDASRLVEEAKKAPLAWVQRLGFLLDLLNANEAANSLLPFVSEHAHRVTPLTPSLSRTGAKRSKKWLIAINTEVEADL